MYRLHDYHWNELMFQVQTVDFNILSHTLPTKLSLDLLRGDLTELQRTLDSGYGFFGLVVTDADGRQIIAMSRSEDRWTRNLQLDHHPYDLLFDPPPTQPQKFYTSYAAKAPTPYPVQPQGRVIGRVYYVRRVPRSFIEDLAIWSQNPFELRDDRFLYTLTCISAVFLGAVGIIGWNAFHLSQQHYRQEKQRLEKERHQVAEALAESRQQLLQTQCENCELKRALDELERAISNYRNEIREYQNKIQTLQELENTQNTLQRLIAQKEVHERAQQEQIIRQLTRGCDSVGYLNTQLLLKLYIAYIIPHYDPAANHLTSGGYLSPLRRIARSLGENFDRLKGIYRELKRACQVADRRFSYRYQTTDDRQCINNFLGTLRARGYITGLGPLAQARSVQGQLNDNFEFINFLNGKWLEMYVHNFITEHYRVEDGWLKNLKYTSLGGQQGEFDLIHLPQAPSSNLDQTSQHCGLVVIECKTGDYAERIRKYQDLRQSLGIPPEQFIMLAVDVADQDLENLSQRYELTFANLGHLRQAFELAIKSATGGNPQQRGVA
ncbi:MAG: hypothetical protein RMI89_06415 [Gloeomargarita sp. SKYBB_i_bin120]|nr:hypothetical protein [Gloeomargarita sp. SKYB120]MDW8178156.1 hypothetical protein [Gloeomargarita sp. SKYBB_i_bin120]